MITRLENKKGFNSGFLKSDRNFNLFWLILFFTMGLIGILNHAMWRDELNVWAIARDSLTFNELVSNVKYEGHPLLWYLCLDFLNHFTQNPLAMQILHLFIATISIFLLLNYSPFTRLQKVLFSFGYLPFYEYLVISRNYAIGLLFIFVFLTVFETRQKSYLLLAIILALMANTNAYCLLIAIAFFISLALEYLLNKKSENLKANTIDIVSSLIVFISGLLCSVLILMPPGDSNLQGGATQWMLQFDLHHLAKALSRIWNSYILILVPAESRLLDVLIFAIISLSIVAFVAIALLEKPFSLCFYLIGSLEILAFTYVKFLGSARHYGHLYIILIASFWLASYYPKSELLTRSLANLPKRIQGAIAFVERQKKTFIAIVLCAQLSAGLVSFSRDLIVPYSASRATARFIQSQQLEKMFIVGSEDFAMTPITGYLERKIYYPESQKLGSFVLFNSQRQIVDADRILQQISQILRDKPQQILLILNSKLEAKRNDLKISFLAEFTKSFIHNEKYYLYLINSNEKERNN
jgi:hypothetical protein